VLLQHQFVVHLVDVIARQNDHVFRRMRFDDVDVLVHRVSRAFVPEHFGDALGGRQDIEALVTFGAHEVPRALHVPDQRVRLVLRCYADAADAGIDRIGQRKIDNPRLAAEIDCGLGAIVGQFIQAAAAATRQDIGHRFTRQRLSYLLPHPGSPDYPAYSSMTVAKGGNVTPAPPSDARTCPKLPWPLPP